MCQDATAILMNAERYLLGTSNVIASSPLASGGVGLRGPQHKGLRAFTQ
jgi:hypothetical protein